MTRRLIILGSTGSIGTQTIDVVEHLVARARERGEPPPWEVVGLATGSNVSAMLEQASRLRARGCAGAGLRLAVARGEEVPAGVARGPDAAEALVRDVPCDVVMAAMVGFAGLPATLAAVTLGRAVALANKETLVAAGALVVPAARRSGAALLPVDSEHSGVWQCLPPPGPFGPDAAAPPMSPGSGIAKVTLTASGGPFRTWELDRLRRATPAEALRHPTWTMGPKVTIDSASLMNKGLELIEAHWLFGLPADRLGAVVHPQSIVHALVEHADGSVVAQLGAPDMRTPIQIALTWPERCPGPSRRLDVSTMGPLTFEPVDPARYPALDLAWEAMRRGGTAGAILSAANEAAVEAFLAPGSSMPFGRIAEVVAWACDAVPPGPISSVQDVLEADAQARRVVTEVLGTPSLREGV